MLNLYDFTNALFLVCKKNPHLNKKNVLSIELKYNYNQAHDIPYIRVYYKDELGFIQSITYKINKNNKIKKIRE